MTEVRGGRWEEGAVRAESVRCVMCGVLCDRPVALFVVRVGHKVSLQGWELSFAVRCAKVVRQSAELRPHAQLCAVLLDVAHQSAHVGELQLRIAELKVIAERHQQVPVTIRSRSTLQH